MKSKSYLVDTLYLMTCLSTMTSMSFAFSPINETKKSLENNVSELLQTEFFEAEENNIIKKEETIPTVSEFDQEIEKQLHDIFQKDKMKAVWKDVGCGQNVHTTNLKAFV